MAKRISKKWIVCIIVFSIAGTYYFLHRPVKNLSIDSNANYQICVPATMKGHDIFFSVPFFRLCSKENALKDQDGKTYFFGRYTIDKDAFIEGKNASELNGMEVTVRQANLTMHM